MIGGFGELHKESGQNNMTYSHDNFVRSQLQTTQFIISKWINDKETIDDAEDKKYTKKPLKKRVGYIISRKLKMKRRQSSCGAQRRGSAMATVC